MQKIHPFLWFDDQAEEAAQFYTSIFEDSSIGKVTQYGRGGPRPEGSVMTVPFRIAGQDFVALNGGPTFQFNPAISLVVNCESQEELDRVWERLLEGGRPEQCGWLVDRYGVSWQIVPANLGTLIDSDDPEATNRVMQAILQMIKIDMETLERAARGE